MPPPIGQMDAHGGLPHTGVHRRIGTYPRRRGLWWVAAAACLPAGSGGAHHPDDAPLGPSLGWGPGVKGERWFVYRDPRLLVHGAIFPGQPVLGAKVRIEVIAQQQGEPFPGGASVILRKQGEATTLAAVQCRQVGSGTYEAELLVEEAGDLELRVTLEGPGGRAVAVPVQVAMSVPWMPFGVAAAGALAFGIWRIRRARREARAE